MKTPPPPYCKYGLQLCQCIWLLSMKMALPLSAERNLSLDLFSNKDFKAVHCLGVTFVLSGVFLKNGTFCFRSMHFLNENTTPPHFKMKWGSNRWDQLLN